jgi:biopolymer transport protein ExbD
MIMNETKNDFQRRIEKIRSKKLKARVDLTAMVSISFLLIIFFMVTIELSKPKTLSLEMPGGDYGCRNGLPYGCIMGENRTLTLLLGDNDKIVSYTGYSTYNIESSKKLKYGKESIRRELINKNQQMHAINGDSKRGIIVIIKPSKKSNFANLVDVLDEMAITRIATYAVVDEFTTEETKLLAAN